MLHVTVTQFHPDDPPELMAELSVDERGVSRIRGPHVEIVGAMSVVDPMSGDRLLSADDPLRWARLLPHAFAGGQVASIREV